MSCVEVVLKRIAGHKGTLNKKKGASGRERLDLNP